MSRRLLQALGFAAVMVSAVLVAAYASSKLPRDASGIDALAGQPRADAPWRAALPLTGAQPGCEVPVDVLDDLHAPVSIADRFGRVTGEPAILTIGRITPRWFHVPRRPFVPASLSSRQAGGLPSLARNAAEDRIDRLVGSWACARPGRYRAVSATMLGGCATVAGTSAILRGMHRV